MAGLDSKAFQRQKRNKSLKTNALGSFVIKGAAMLVSLVAMPVYLNYFGNESVMGVWFTLLSVLNWVLLFDFGVGNGLRNRLTLAFAKRDESLACKLISSSYVLLGVISLCAFLVSAVVVRLINWNTVLGVSANVLSRDDLLASMMVVFSVIWLQFYLKLITGVLYAMQRAVIPSLLTLTSNVLILFSALLYRPDSASKALLYLSVSYGISTVVPLLIASFIVLGRLLPFYSFRISDCSFTYAREIVNIGMRFFLLQLLSMAVFNTREVLISSLVGVDQVVDYTVYFKVYSLISTFYLLALTPFWSAITQAFAQHDFDWIRGVYKKGLGVLCLFSFAGVAALIMFPFAVQIWLEDAAPETNYLTGLIFIVFNIEYMFINLNAHIENGIEKLGVQTAGYAIAAISLIGLSILFSRVHPVWDSVMLASVIALVPMCCMQSVELKKLFSAWR